MAKRILGLLMLTLTLVATTAFAAPLKIGVLAPISGSSAADGNDIVKGVKTAVEVIKAEGGVPGFDSIVVEVQDDACDPKQAVTGAGKLANAKVIKAGMVLTIPGKTAEPKPVADKTTAALKPEKEVKEKDVKEKEVKEPKTKGSKADPYGVEAATAPEKGGKKKPGKADDDSTYEKIKVEFHEYAKKWLEKSAALAQYSKDKREVKMEDGRYVASYSIILVNTMQTEVKRVEYEHTPYVGHITYQLEVHRTFGPTPQAAMASREEEVKQENMREIFSYSGQKRAWR